MSILKLWSLSRQYGPEVWEFLGVVFEAVKQRDPEKAAQYARRAALSHTFDMAQKAKRKELWPNTSAAIGTVMSKKQKVIGIATLVVVAGLGIAEILGYDISPVCEIAPTLCEKKVQE
jgi:hypothetical protein